MNNWKVKEKRKNMEFEIAFTSAYRKAMKEAGDNILKKEITCLRAQYPAILHPIEDEDIFAGRIYFGAVGLGIQHQTGGFGYYINEDLVTKELISAPGSLKYREDLHDLLTFWRTENTNYKIMNAMPEHLKKVLFTDAWETTPLPACPILRMAGSYLNFDKLVSIGIPGLEAEIKGYLETAEADGKDPEFYKALLEALEILKDVCFFYRDQALAMMKTASPQRAAELKIMADVLEKITISRPQSLREAIQLTWIYGLIAPVVEYGRIDIYLGDFYVHDVDNGIITEEEALRMVQCFFRLIDHLDCEVDGRVIVGGYGRRNPENADRFCMVALEACRTVKEVLPQFTLRFNKETPKCVWDLAMRCIEEGRTFPLLYNDDVLVPAVMEAFNVSRELAETYVPLGCGEIEFDHYSIGTPSGSMNTLKILEIAINGGYDPIANWRIGPQTKGLAECESFEEFFEIYKQHLRYYIEAQAEFEKYEYDITGTLHPFLYITMLYDGCVEKGKPIFAGGCEYLAGTLELYGNVNAADSLTAIKELVFDKKVISAQRLIEALRNNFVGFEKERKMMMDCPKYGNDDPVADNMLLELHNYLCNTIKEQAPRVGLKSYLAVIINNAQNTTLARWVGASADGRKAGCPMANANNPSPGNDKKGITAMLNSILKPTHANHAGMVQNIRFSRETFASSREKVMSLIDSYFQRGGAHAMITVVGKDDLENAMKRPEEYRDLIVRVGGFSARFVDLPKDVQKEVYERVTY